MRFAALALIVALMSVPRPAIAAGEADAGPPFGRLPLVDEIECAEPADAGRFHEEPPGASTVATILGRRARAMTMDASAKVFAYKIGVGKGLKPGRAYLLCVEYPEDAGRQIVIINRGAQHTRTLATGQTIGDARESYTYPSPESLKYPLSGKWETHRTLFFLHDRFLGVKAGRDETNMVFEDEPADGFWVVIGQFRIKDSPLDAGAAVARIRLFEVPNPEAFDQPIRFPPDDQPRRRIAWREEMADQIINDDDPAKRGVSDSLQWFDHKMRLSRFLGVRTFSKDLLEFGHNQHWESTPHGAHAWIYMGNQRDLWEKIVDRAARHDLDILPYYEYAGAIGGGQGDIPSYGKRGNGRPLGDRAHNVYSDVPWSEKAHLDVTDPDARVDVEKLLDATIARFKDRARFAGAWFRTRPSNWPISFTDETLARFAAEANNGAAPTRAQLQADHDLLKRYYAWWFDKRRDYLVFIRDYLRANINPDAQVIFDAYPQEALRAPEVADSATPTDDMEAWEPIQSAPDSPWRWRFRPVPWRDYVDDGKYLDRLTRMTPPSAEVLAKHWQELDHSAPPADPERYMNTKGVYMAMPFGRLYTTSSAEPLEAFRSADGLAIVRHYNLNEEDGQNPDAREGPMSKRVGYFVTDVDRAGPYCVLAEARALAFGDPRFIGYLSSSGFNRGFPEYVRAFNAAFLALPALPSERLADAASDPEIIVRKIPTPRSGTFFAVVNTSMRPKEGVVVNLPGAGSVLDVVADRVVSSTPRLTLNFYPGQVYALKMDE